MSRLKLKAPKRRRKFETSPNELFQSGMIDCLLWGNPNKPGWIEMYASPKGRECINAVFPQAHIEWRSGDLPMGPEWGAFEINFLRTMENTRTSIDLRIAGDKLIEDASQDQLVFLLAMAAKNNGARVAHHTQSGVMNIYTSGAGH